jgi:hypothetical protein
MSRKILSIILIVSLCAGFSLSAMANEKATTDFITVSNVIMQSMLYEDMHYIVVTQGSVLEVTAPIPGGIFAEVYSEIHFDDNFDIDGYELVSTISDEVAFAVKVGDKITLELNKVYSYYIHEWNGVAGFWATSIFVVDEATAKLISTSNISGSIELFENLYVSIEPESAFVGDFTGRAGLSSAGDIQHYIYRDFEYAMFTANTKSTLRVNLDTQAIQPDDFAFSYMINFVDLNFKPTMFASDNKVFDGKSFTDGQTWVADNKQNYLMTLENTTSGVATFTLPLNGWADGMYLIYFNCQTPDMSYYFEGDIVIIIGDKTPYIDGLFEPITAVDRKTRNFPTAQSIIATPTASKVLVNGKDTAFDAYLIDGSNYFKLRDLAFVINGTQKQFQVGWDGANNAISLTSKTAYTPVGGEMARSTTTGNKTPTATSSKIFLDGKEINLTAYLIDGNNYFKLRDIMKIFDVYVGWDGATSTITLDTSRSYED